MAPNGPTPTAATTSVTDPKVDSWRGGAELAFEEGVGCDTGMVSSWRLGHTVAKFQQVDKNRSNVYHDALEFPDGKIVLLTHLCKGQTATVLQLPASAPVKIEVKQRQFV